jgi:MSHA biogenesis protein MshL
MAGKMNLSRSWVVVGFVVALGGCQSWAPKSASLEPEIRASEVLAQASRDHQTVSEADILDDLVPPAAPLSAPPPEPRFDISVHKVSARAFFFGLVKDTPYNVVLAPGVDGHISLNLKNVTLPQVMDIVRDVYGYEYTLQQGVYTVLPVRPRTEIFPMEYINLQRIGRSSTMVNSGQASSSQTSGNAQGSARNGTSGQRGSSSGGTQVSTQRSTEIETRTDADIWKELEKTLRVLVADSKEAQVVVSPQAGVVVVRAEPQALRMVRRYLHMSEGNLSRQVILEAKVLEVTLNNGQQTGIDWRSFGIVNSDNVLNLAQVGQPVLANNANDTLQGVFSAVYQKDDFNAIIELLKTQGQVHVLSTPRISTLNNQKAVIKVGTDEFFVTDVSTTTVASTSAATVTPDVTLTPFFSGIALDVTPQISEAGEVILHIHPSVSEVTDQTKVFKLGSDEFSLPLALSTIRESDSIVRAKSKQIVVIGGLMQEKVVDSEAGTPFVSDLPLVGGLFRQTKQTKVKSELVILLKAEVVQPDTWKRQLEEASERMRQLEQR